MYWSEGKMKKLEDIPGVVILTDPPFLEPPGPFWLWWVGPIFH